MDVITCVDPSEFERELRLNVAWYKTNFSEDGSTSPT